MERIARLFSLKGRSSRLAYWQVQLACAAWAGVVWIVGVSISIQDGWTGAIPVATLALPVYVGFAVSIRRLHDRNKSAWWLVLFFLAPAALAFGAGFLNAMARMQTSAGLMLGALALAVAEIGLSLWGFVEIGLLRGTRGPNAYGPDPAIG